MLPPRRLIMRRPAICSTHAASAAADERHRASSVSQPGLLRFGGQLIENGPSASFVILPVCEQISDSNTTMRAHQTKGNLAFVEQAHKERTRNVEHAGGLLGGQFRMNRHDGYRVPVCHLLEGLEEQVERFARDGDGNRAALAIRTNLHGAGSL